MSTLVEPTGSVRNFRFLSPREVRSGIGSSARAGEILSRYTEPGKVLVVCDPFVRSLGGVDSAIGSLNGTGWGADVFDEIDREPNEHTIARVHDAIRSNAYRAVVGIGGGSAMDVAKVASALATTSQGLPDFIGVDRLAADPLPLVLIPTTAGTGAEATRIAMVTVDGKKRVVNDSRLVATAAILDGALTASAPPAVTASTGMDALSHAIEGALSTDSSPFSRNAGHDAIRMLATWLPRAVADGSDLAARQSVLDAAYLAGLALNAGSVLGHSIGYTIANRTGLAHGLSVAIALPHCVAYNARAAHHEIARIWECLDDTRGNESDLQGWLASFTRALGISTSLGELGLTTSDIPDMVNECIAEYPRTNNPATFDRDRLTTLYEQMFEEHSQGRAPEDGLRTLGSPRNVSGAR